MLIHGYNRQGIYFLYVLLCSDHMITVLLSQMVQTFLLSLIPFGTYQCTTGKEFKSGLHQIKSNRIIIISAVLMGIKCRWRCMVKTGC